MFQFESGGPNGEVSSFAWFVAFNTSSLFNGLEDFDFLGEYACIET